MNFWTQNILEGSTLHHWNQWEFWQWYEDNDSPLTAFEVGMSKWINTDNSYVGLKVYAKYNVLTMRTKQEDFAHLSLLF